MKELRTAGVASRGHHARCYRSKATVNWLLQPKRGVEFIDISGEGNHSRHDWVRAMCRVGFMPCNGILYSTPHPCFCYPGVKIKGFNALRNQVHFPASDSDVRLVKGPAFGKIDAPAGNVVKHLSEEISDLSPVAEVARLQGSQGNARILANPATQNASQRCPAED